MAFNITQFQGSMKFGGARGALFEVRVTNPINPSADSDFPFKCRAAQIPAADVESIEVPYFGRMVRFAGNRTFAEWSVTVLNDEDFAVRNTLEQWNAAINGFQTNQRNVGVGNPLDYKSDAQVIQYSKTGSVLREYTFVGLYPQSVGSIDLSWDSNDIEVFDVTFAYDYWIVSGGTTGNPNVG